MLEEIFLKVVDMSLMAGIIIVAVAVARIFLKSYPKIISYVLWCIVLFRLVCPFNFESYISLVPQTASVSYQYSLSHAGNISSTGGKNMDTNVGESTSAADGINTASNDNVSTDKSKLTEQVKASGEKITGNVSDRTSWSRLCLYHGKATWLSGLIIILLYGIYAAIRVKWKIRTAIPYRENIYLTDQIKSPFVMGLFKPGIYLPENLKDREYVILHEQIHIKRRDYIVKILAYVVLAIHWFNPLVWMAFIMSSKDMEMSCDEAVIRKMGKNIRADYASSLLALSTGHQKLGGVPLAFGEGDTKARIKNLARNKRNKRVGIVLLFWITLMLIVCLAVNIRVSGKVEADARREKNGTDTQTEELHLSMNIEEHYITNTGDPSNLYHIDENGTLWGCGRNNYGQLGQGNTDYDFHSDMIKIADNVIHVDFSQSGFTIFLTGDHKLYGMGNAGCGALQQYEDFDWDRYINAEHYTVNEPYLMMEDVAYARCGRDDVICLKEDKSVWTWGTLALAGGYGSGEYYYNQVPQKVLDNAVLVTGGWFNHSALLEDGSLWTWGYNSAGNCGLADPYIVSQPTKVMDNVVMAWTGSMEYNSEYTEIEDFDGIYPVFMNNTVVEKSDGTYWICGENVGSKEKTIQEQEGSYTVTCSAEFLPYQGEFD